MPIDVVLIDDHAVVREGVELLLNTQPDIRVVGSFGEGHTAIRHIEEHVPDVAVLDIAMPGSNGIDLARELQDVSPGTQILMLSVHAEPEYIARAFLAGAQGYVVKESAGRVLIEAIHAVHRGERFVSGKVDRLLLDERLREQGMIAPLDRLSAREREVLQRTVEGMTIAETARQLGLSPKSVETYRSRLMAKLGIDHVPGLVKFAIRHGITTVT